MSASILPFLSLSFPFDTVRTVHVDFVVQFQLTRVVAWEAHGLLSARNMVKSQQGYCSN